MIKSIFRIVLDSHTSIDYKHKREILELADSKTTLTEMVSVASNYLKQNIKDYKVSLFESSFKDRNYENLLKSYSLKGITVITECSEDYPNELKNIPFAPICLYAMGNVDLLKSDKKFSIVGSRKTMPSVQKLTENISKTLAENGVTIVTGIANGGDLCAIKGAIATKKVISVLASGFDFCDMEYNRDYIARLQKEGLVITEHAPTVKARPYFYPVRNRIIAGLSKGTLIVSGTYKSGARHTANYALEYGRDVFAIPYAPFTSSGELCNKLIKEGAYLVEDASDVATVCGFNLKQDVELKLADIEVLVLNAIKNGNGSIDDIMSATEMKIYELIPVVSVLEIKGYIVKNGNGDYVVAQK